MQIWERVRHFLVVVVITWLVWYAADRRVTDREDFTLRIAVRTTDPLTTASIESPKPSEVKATLEGTRGRLDAFNAWLSKNQSAVIEYVLGSASSDPGQKQVASDELLAASRVIRDSGLDVIFVRPPLITLRVDRLETVKVRVQPDFGGVSVEGSVVQPAVVEVRGIPRRLLDTRLADRTLRPSAEQAIRQWLTANPDKTEFTIELPLSIPEASQDVEFSPAPTVKVTGRSVSLLSTAKKGPVQIVFAIPVDVERQYIVRPAESANLRPDIQVRGPTSSIEQLTPQQIVVFVEVLASDVSGTVRTVRRAPRVILPPGFELAREMQEVEFELVERSTPSGTE